MYKLLILTFKAFINRTAPMYLCEQIEQQKSSTNTRTRLTNDAFLLKLVVVVCHDQVRRQVSQGFRCRGS